MVRTVDEDEIELLRPRSARVRDTFEPELTPSLEKALDYFALACTARRLREHDDHSSMLVHTTLYADSHERIKTVVEQHWNARARAVKRGTKAVLASLRALWNDERERVPASQWNNPEHTFDDLLPLLPDVMKETSIIVENGQSLERLTYTDTARTQIAIGGNTLSRGLTLEGLLVSLFVRSASAYDTLLQMGRWFGYRFGYEDLPRIWMTDELREAFVSLATVEQEIRNDIARYETEELTPVQFGVRIRTHPSLAITSRLKMGKAIPCKIAYSHTTTQARFYRHRDREWLQKNQRAARRLLEQAPKAEVDGQYRIHRNVPVRLVLEFLDTYDVHERHTDLQRANVTGYIRAQQAEGDLRSWNVVVAQRKHKHADLGTLRLGPGAEVNLTNRAKLKSLGDDSYANLGTITSQAYLQADLPESERGSGPRPPDAAPLLLLVPISANSKKMRNSKSHRESLGAVDHIVGVALSFPKARKETPQSYVHVDLSGIERDEEELFEDEEASDTDQEDAE